MFAKAAFNEEYRNIVIAVHMSGNIKPRARCQRGKDSEIENKAPKDSIIFKTGSMTQTNGVWRPNQISDAAAAKAKSE